MKQQVRIIAGTLRGRKISFLDDPQLRPTPDRVRETLFNWLAPFIQGAECLDLFTGSGALAFEAISRGAKKVVALEQNPAIIQSLKQNTKQLNIQNLEIIQSDARRFLNGSSHAFDIIFIDPPYQSDLLQECFVLLANPGWVKSNTLIYFESNKIVPIEQLHSSWEIMRNKKAGQVYFYLAKVL